MEKNKTEVLFFSDTEDYTDPSCADAILRLIEIMEDEGVRGQFSLVGLLTEKLEVWGRGDIIAALRRQVIGTHTYAHSMHPDICEATDLRDYKAAYSAAARSEGRAIDAIERIVAPKRIMYACPPGNSCSYCAMYYYADRGIPYYSASVIKTPDGRGVCCCGLEHLPYTAAVEHLFCGAKRTDIPELLDSWGGRAKRVIVYTHPNMATKKEYWDVLNFDKRNLHIEGSYITAADRTPESTQDYFNGLRELIRAIRADDRFEITDLDRLYAQRTARPPVTIDSIPAIRDELSRSFGPVISPALSLSDVFCAAVTLLQGGQSYTPGAVKGFLSAPRGAGQAVTLTADEIRATASRMDISGFLPESTDVGGTQVGPADFLYAALAVLCGSGRVTLLPRPQLPDISSFKELSSFALRGTWRHSPSLEDRWLSDRLRLQSWTIYYPGVNH